MKESSYYKAANILLDRAVNLYEDEYTDIFEADELRLNVTYSDIEPHPEAYIPNIPRLTLNTQYISIFFLYTGIIDNFTIIVRSYADGDDEENNIYQEKIHREHLVEILTKLLEDDVCIMTS